MVTLRTELIKLAHRNPSIRGDLLPVIKRYADTRPTEDVIKSNDATTTPEELSEIAGRSKDYRTLGLVARHNNTPPSVLADLSINEDGGVRAMVAKNPKTPVDVLRKLYKDSDKNVIKNLATNPSTPVDILKDIVENSTINGITDDILYNHSLPSKLIESIYGNDPHFHANLTRYASNPNTPPEILGKMVGRYADYVDRALVENPSTPKESITAALDKYKFSGTLAKTVATYSSDLSLLKYLLDMGETGPNLVYASMAANPAATTDILMELLSKVDGLKPSLARTCRDQKVLATLAKDKDHNIRMLVARNQSTSIAIIKTLSKDRSQEVSEFATRRLFHLDPSLKEFKGDPKIIKKSLTSEQSEKVISGMDSLGDKESYSWGEVSKALGVPSLPGPAQKEIIALKDKSGRVDTGKLKETVTKLVGGKHMYDIGIDAYSGVQTIHPKKKTSVIQINASQEFWAAVESSGDQEVVKRYMNWINGYDSGHPVEKGKTIAWARVTDFGKQKTLIVEELQSDVCSGKAIEAFVRSSDDKASTSATLSSLRKMVGDWEFSALQAVKRFAEHKGYQTLYMVPGSVKSRGNKRSIGYESGSDSALKRIYDEIPAKVGFHLVPKVSLPEWLQKPLKDEDSMWVISTHQMKVGKIDEKSLRSALIRLAHAKPELRKHLLPIIKKSNDEKVNLAHDPSTPIGVLAELARDPKDNVRALVARNPSTPPEVLVELARDPNDSVRAWVAGNKSTPVWVLAELAKDPKDNVRTWVARNGSIPVGIMAELARDPKDNVRIEVVRNLSAPISILVTLSEDTSGVVSEAATRRLYKVDPSLKEFKGDPKVFHKLLNPEQIEKLVKDNSSLPEKASYSWGEVSKALNVPSLPKEVQLSLSGLKDKSGRVDYNALKGVVTKLVGGSHRYDIGLDAYSGAQTIHPKKKTSVIQLNISGEFEAKLESSPDYDVIENYINWITGYNSGHPVEKGKTIAWVRVTDFPENKTLIIEELQSDISNSKAISLYCDHNTVDPSSIRSLIDIVGEWEYCALRAVKQFAEHKGYQTLYMVPGSVKAKGNKRSEGYESGSDSA